MKECFISSNKDCDNQSSKSVKCKSNGFCSYLYKVIFHLYKCILWKACKVISINIKGKIEFYDFVMHQKD